MADFTQSVTVIASMVGADEIVAKARTISKAVGSISAAAKANESATMAMAKSTSGYSDALGQLQRRLKDTNTALLDWSSSVQTKVVKTAKDATLAVAGLTAGLTALGLSAANAFQSATLDISTFGGGMSLSQAAGLANQLRGSMTGKLSLSTLTGGYEQLLAAGLTGQNGVQLAQSLAAISATRQDPAGTYSALADAIGRVSQYGILDARSSRSLINAGVPIIPMLAQHLGIAQFQVRRALEGGNPMYAPWLVQALTTLNDPLLRGFQGGVQKANTGTLGGAFGFVKLSLANAMADLFTGGGNGKAGTGGAARSLTQGIAGLGTSGARLIQQYGPEVMAFVAGLGRYLPSWAKSGRDLLHAVEPLVPAFKNFTVAFAKIGPRAVSDVATLVSVLTHGIAFVSDIVKGMANTPVLGGLMSHAVADGFIGLFAALALYKTVQGVTTFISGFIDSVRTLQTVLAGGSAAQAGAAGAGAATTAEAGAGVAGGVAGGLVMAGLTLAAGRQTYKLAHQKKTEDPITDLSGFIMQGLGKSAKADWDLIFGGGHHKAKVPLKSTSGTDSGLVPQPITVHNHFTVSQDSNAVRGAVKQGTIDAVQTIARDQAARGHVAYQGVK